MKIVVISLADQAERRAAISRQMGGLGIQFEFFDAIRGASDRFPEAIAAAGELIERFGIIRLEPFRRESRPTRARTSAHRVLTAGDFELYYLADPPLCMTGYAVSPSAARKLVDASRKLIGPVDKFLQRTWQHGVPLFALDPATIGIEDEDNVTTIGDPSCKSWNPLLLLTRLVYKTNGRARRHRFNAGQLWALGISARGDRPPGRIHRFDRQCI